MHPGFYCYFIDFFQRCFNECFHIYKLMIYFLDAFFFKWGNLKWIRVVKKNIMCLYDTYLSVFFKLLFYALF